MCISHFEAKGEMDTLSITCFAMIVGWNVCVNGWMGHVVENALFAWVEKRYVKTSPEVH